MHRVTLLAALALAAAASAQDAPPQDVLRGPAVAPAATAPTLVERDFQGKVRRLDLPPEEAALALLGLDADARAKADAILTEREAILDAAVIGNIELLLKINTAREAGDRAEVLRLLQEFNAALAPLRARGSLADELAAALPSAKAAALDTLVDEYNKALYDQSAAEARARGEAVRPARIRLRESLLATGQEVKRSYDRQVAAGLGEIDRLVAILALRPEQESKVRNLVAEFGQMTRLNPTPEQRRDLFQRIMAELDPEQRRMLLREVLGQAAPGED